MSKLDEWLADNDPKRFKIISKHYYDLFAYHAAQRLTTFNFFIVSLAFFSNAYATLLTKSGGSASRFLAASVLALTAYLFALAFAKLDKRNEQIISTNEEPLACVQKVFQKTLGVDAVIKPVTDNRRSAGLWQTFAIASEKSRFLTTFGQVIPLIYFFATCLSISGAAYSYFLATHRLIGPSIFSAILMIGSAIFIYFDLPLRSRPAKAAPASDGKV